MAWRGLALAPSTGYVPGAAAVSALGAAGQLEYTVVEAEIRSGFGFLSGQLLASINHNDVLPDRHSGKDVKLWPWPRH